ncbi:MAG: PH domain-containing protein [Candidatus Saccharimonadales bacterium]
MKPEDSSDKGYDQPVAYDAQGNPLYAHPPKSGPQIVHMTRPIDPIAEDISPEAQKRHERSQRAYPNVNLSTAEYVISAVRRHPIGLVAPLSIGTLIIALALSLLANYSAFADYFGLQGALADTATVIMPVMLFCLLVSIGMGVVYYVYTNNRFYLTNESVIQEIQVSLFGRLEQTVSLANVEDASYTQEGFFQSIFDYGSIRLSTEGDETTYRFAYVARPKERIATLNDAVEAFKNGRPTGE